MPKFSIRNPYFIIVVCLVLLVLGVTSVARMPVDLFPPINLPEVVVATFYSGMPPQDIEIDMTNPLERFFTLASGIDHMESRSMLGVSIIKIYFQPGTNADADVTEISNLALADLKRLPPGTLPPVVLKFDASSLPVCLVTVKGRGAHRNAASRLCPVCHPQPDCGGEGGGDPAAVWREVPAGHGVRGPLQAPVASDDAHGRGGRGEPIESDPARRRCEDGPLRLLRLFQ